MNEKGSSWLWLVALVALLLFWRWKAKKAPQPTPVVKTTPAPAPTPATVAPASSPMPPISPSGEEAPPAVEVPTVRTPDNAFAPVGRLPDPTPTPDPAPPTGSADGSSLTIAGYYGEGADKTSMMDDHLSPTTIAWFERVSPGTRQAFLASEPGSREESILQAELQNLLDNWQSMGLPPPSTGGG